MSTEIEMREALRLWLAKKNNHLNVHDIDDAFPLLEEKLITSLQVTDLLLFIEQLRGMPVTIDEIKPTAFASINAIYETFLKGASQCA